MITHSAVLPTSNHSNLAVHVIPGNPQWAASTVVIHNVSFDDAVKLSAEVAKHGLAPLDWEPPITVSATPPAEVKPVGPVPPSEPEQPSSTS